MISIVLLIAVIQHSDAIQNVASNQEIFSVTENIRNGAGVFYKSHDYHTVLSCGHACMRNPRCKATNFRQGKDGRRSECEFVDWSTPYDFSSLENNNEWIFTQSMKDDCRFKACRNEGSCSYNRKKAYRCSCPLLWTGDECQNIQISKATFNFTTLGFHGRHGPTNNNGYQATVLQGIQVTKGNQIWVVPVNGIYHVTACGAAGGDGSLGSRGGRGAMVNGTIELQKDEKLKILVGQMGDTADASSLGSGGGGTFITRNDNNALVIAGGGGGGGFGSNGGDAPTNCSDFGGSGGDVCVYQMATSAGGGGGFQANGRCYLNGECINVDCEHGGKSFVNGGEGGKASSKAKCNGGFGGGGACDNAPGGGGGYSGGDVALYSNGTTYAFSKGGCSLAPRGGMIIPGYNNNHGYVTIKLVQLL